MRKIDNPTDEAIRDKLLREIYANEYNKFLGFEMMELNVNYSKSRMKNAENIHNPYGSIHGGALLSFVDACAGTTASMCGKYVTTVNCNLNFLLPAAKTEYIYCECLKLRTGRHILVYDIRVTDDSGNLLDSGEFSFFVSKVDVLSDERLEY